MLKTGLIRVGGVETFSTVDFPDKISAVIFMQGCPWRCPFCHNAALQDAQVDSGFIWEKFIEFLQSRRKVLDAVVFSGGEPLLQPGLAAAMSEVKALGYQIGLHTGGYNPEHLARILPFTDWVGLDIKAPFVPQKYTEAVGGIDSLSRVEKSLRLLLAAGGDFECRTTCDPRLLTVADIYALAEKLAAFGVKKYYLQKYRPIAGDKRTTDEDCEAIISDEKLLAYLQSAFTDFAVRR